MYDSVFDSITGLSDSVIKNASCLTGTDLNKLIAALLIAQQGVTQEAEFTDTTPLVFNVTPGTNGTVAAASASDNSAATWIFEYQIDGEWETFDTQPPDGMFDIRVQFPASVIRLTPSAVVGTIKVAVVG